MECALVRENGAGRWGWGGPELALATLVLEHFSCSDTFSSVLSPGGEGGLWVSDMHAGMGASSRGGWEGGGERNWGVDEAVAAAGRVGLGLESSGEWVAGGSGVARGEGLVRRCCKFIYFSGSEAFCIQLYIVHRLYHAVSTIRTVP